MTFADGIETDLAAERGEVCKFVHADCNSWQLRVSDWRDAPAHRRWRG